MAVIKATTKEMQSAIGGAVRIITAAAIIATLLLCSGILTLFHWFLDDFIYTHDQI